MNAHALQVEASRVALGLALSDEASSFARTFLERGEYSAAAVELSELRPATVAEVKPLLEAWLREYQLPYPSDEEAIWILLRHHIGALAEAEAEHDVRRELNAVRDLYYAGNLQGRSQQYAGDSHDIERLYGISWEFSDLADTFRVSPDPVALDAAIADLSSGAREEARRWCKAHSA